jgi:ABC-type nickel/cobalt efflux system permease component RcnA
MERDRIVRWLYALGIGLLMFAATLFLLLLYRFTAEALFTAVLCTIIGITLFVGAFAVNRIWTRHD